MSLSEYNKALDQLNRNAYIEARGSQDKQTLESEYFKKLQEAVSKPLFGENEKIQEELAKVEKEYETALSLAKTKLDKKLISEDEYRQAIIDATLAAANSAVSIEGIGDAADEFIDKVRGEAISNIKAPILGKRDTTFDYKSSEKDKLSGELDVWKEYRDELEELKKKHGELSKDLQDKLNNAMSNVKNLEEAVKIAEVKEDIESLSKELNEGLYSGIKNIASSSDRIVSAFSNLKDVCNNVDASGWERILAIWDAMTNTIDAFLSIIEMIENLTEVTKKLTLAKETEAAIDKATTATKV